MQNNLQTRIDRLKTTALMKQRERMGPVELINWWASFQVKTRFVTSFDKLDADTQSQILKWESDPYKIIGT